MALPVRRQAVVVPTAVSISVPGMAISISDTVVAVAVPIATFHVCCSG